jgi:hypothetical protein
VSTHQVAMAAMGSTGAAGGHLLKLSASTGRVFRVHHEELVVVAPATPNALCLWCCQGVCACVCPCVSPHMFAARFCSDSLQPWCAWCACVPACPDIHCSQLEYAQLHAWVAPSRDALSVTESVRCRISIVCSGMESPNHALPRVLPPAPACCCCAGVPLPRLPPGT